MGDQEAVDRTETSAQGERPFGGPSPVSPRPSADARGTGAPTCTLLSLEVAGCVFAAWAIGIFCASAWWSCGRRRSIPGALRSVWRPRRRPVIRATRRANVPPITAIVVHPDRAVEMVDLSVPVGGAE